MKKKLTQKIFPEGKLTLVEPSFVKTLHQEIFNISIYIQGLIKVKRECRSWMSF